MFFAVIHLSDIHIEDATTLSEEKIADIIKTVNHLIEKYKIEQIIMIVTGDLSFSCKQSQYEIFDCHLTRIMEGINIVKEPLVVLSPGNHDVDFAKKKMSRLAILKAKNKDIKKIKEDYFEKMDNFFAYASKYNCFIQNKEIDSLTIKIGGMRIKINNINSALYSTFKDTNNDNDKGLHNIDSTCYGFLKREECELVLTIMHHSPEWYDEASIYKLKDIVKKETDILLCGHEHVNDELDYNYGNSFFTTKICGGPLSPGEGSLFNSIVFNTNNKKYVTTKYQWDEEGGTYKMIENDERVLTKYLRLKEYFYNELIRDSLVVNASDFRDFYVFPELVIESDFDSEERIISNVKDLKKELESKSVCIINGVDYSGKSTLCKYLFLSYAEEKIPVLFDLKALDRKTIGSAISNAFSEQYNQQLLDYSSFEKEDRNNKVAIIDDADKIDKNQFEILVDELRKYFGLVIIINGLKSEYDLLELAKNHIEESDKRLIVRIGKFYNEERKQLIKKTCRLLLNNMTDSMIEERALLVNRVILNKIKLFNLYPPFIVLFVKSMINNGFELGAKDVFNEVFSSNITNMMTQSGVEVSLMTTLLQRIAYYIHTNKEYPISIMSISKIVEQYNQEGKGYRKVVRTADVVNDLIKSRLLKNVSSDDSYCFTNNSFLAYFIAKEWLRVQDHDVLTKIINNTCYGINGDILLYICFMYENAQKLFFDEILAASNAHFNGCEELDFIKNNIKFILRDKKEMSIALPTKKDKAKAQRSIKDQEKAITKDSTINYIDIYDYNEEAALDDSLKFAKGMKYVEILSKILPDFIYKMEAEQISRFVDAIYRMPNKLLFSVLKPVDDEYVKELSGDWLKQDVNRFEFNRTIQEIQDMSKVIVLNIYDFVARYSATKNTITALENFQYSNNINYAIQKSLFYSELGDTDKFDSVIMSVYNATDKKAVKNLVSRIYYKHLVYNKVEYKGTIQAHISKVFPSINRPNKALQNKGKFLRFIRSRKKK